MTNETKRYDKCWHTMICKRQKTCQTIQILLTNDLCRSEHAEDSKTTVSLVVVAVVVVVVVVVVVMFVVVVIVIA
jgi:hypothetical protein